MSEKHNSEVFLRPRFKIDFNESVDNLMSKFRNNLKDNSCDYCSKIVDNHIFIDVPKIKDHYWSPHLHLEIVKDEGEEGRTLVKGLFSPKPQVWTMFIFLHFAIGILFSIFLVMLYVRWTLGAGLIFSTIMVSVLPIIWISLYVIGRLGRRKGKSQMLDLHEFMMDTLNN